MPDRAYASRPVSVMHMTDTLEIGGAERMAVNLVNGIPRSRVIPHICTTRRSGPLEQLVAPDVGQLRLYRRHRVDARAVRRLVAYIRQHDIEILHAHGTALFTAVAASMFRPYPKVVWHIHFGRYAADQSPGRLYRMVGDRVHHTIAVSEPLAEWAQRRLRMPPDRVAYIPNFAAPVDEGVSACHLPGEAGERIVCVANFLPEKDHLTLLRAMVWVVRERPSAHLLLVGGGNNSEYEARVRQFIERRRLTNNVSILGQRRDVPAILRAADVGVLSSVAEGLPLALIEYGAAGLAAVATRVGQCPDVLAAGHAGLLVPPAGAYELAQSILRLLCNPEERHSLGQQLHDRVRHVFNAPDVIERVCSIYERVALRGDGLFNG